MNREAEGRRHAGHRQSIVWSVEGQTITPIIPKAALRRWRGEDGASAPEQETRWTHVTSPLWPSLLITVSSGSSGQTRAGPQNPEVKVPSKPPTSAVNLKSTLYVQLV